MSKAVFVLMAAVLPAVMNSWDEVLRAASITYTRTDGGWKLVLVVVGAGQGGAHMPPPSVSTYVHTQPVRGVFVCWYLALTGPGLIFLLVTVWSL